MTTLELAVGHPKEMNKLQVFFSFCLIVLLFYDCFIDPGFTAVVNLLELFTMGGYLNLLHK